MTCLKGHWWVGGHYRAISLGREEGQGNNFSYVEREHSRYGARALEVYTSDAASGSVGTCGDLLFGFLLDTPVVHWFSDSKHSIRNRDIDV